MRISVFRSYRAAQRNAAMMFRLRNYRVFALSLAVDCDPFAGRNAPQHHVRARAPTPVLTAYVHATGVAAARHAKHPANLARLATDTRVGRPFKNACDTFSRRSMRALVRHLHTPRRE